LNPIALLNGHWPVPRNGAAVPQNVAEWIEQSRADVFFETSSLDPQTGQPATQHLMAALQHGAHAITANKGPVVHAYEALNALARERDKKFLCESTVMDGVPIFSLFPFGLPAAELRGFSGVLNSTTNVVLTEVEKGLSFDDAVRRAQALGIAETDPANDLDGWDSAVKVVALTTVLMGIPVQLEQVQRTGIRELSEEKIRSARAAGCATSWCAARRGAAPGLIAWCSRNCCWRRSAGQSGRNKFSDSFRPGCVRVVAGGAQSGSGCDCLRIVGGFSSRVRPLN